jgi:hypothetical protein
MLTAAEAALFSQRAEVVAHSCGDIGARLRPYGKLVIHFRCVAGAFLRRLRGEEGRDANYEPGRFKDVGEDAKFSLGAAWGAARAAGLSAAEAGRFFEVADVSPRKLPCARFGDWENQAKGFDEIFRVFKLRLDAGEFAARPRRPAAAAAAAAAAEAEAKAVAAAEAAAEGAAAAATAAAAAATAAAEAAPAPCLALAYFQYRKPGSTYDYEPATEDDVLVAAGAAADGNSMPFVAGEFVRIVSYDNFLSASKRQFASKLAAAYEANSMDRAGAEARAAALLARGQGRGYCGEVRVRFKQKAWCRAARSLPEVMDAFAAEEARRTGAGGSGTQPASAAKRRTAADRERRTEEPAKRARRADAPPAPVPAAGPAIPQPAPAPPGPPPASPPPTAPQSPAPAETRLVEELFAAAAAMAAAAEDKPAAMHLAVHALWEAEEDAPEA